MAEVFGIVSGAIGVAGIAVQIIQSVQKLKLFLSKLRFVHAHLEELLDELDLLATLISQSDYPGPSELVGAIERDASTPLACCEKAAKSILAVVDNVQGGFKRGQKHGTKASVKFILNEKQIEENLRKLERAKSMLVLAQQCLLQ